MLGLDFSIKSPAATVLHNNEYHFYSWQWGLTKIHESLMLAGVNVIVPEQYKTFSGSESTYKERTFTNECDSLTTSMVDNLSKYSGPYAIEGFSFGSTGNRLAQLSGYQHVFRYKMNKHFNVDNMWIFAPMTVKATAGKGNFKKEKMIEAFLNSEDPILKKNKFFQTLKNTPEEFQNKKGQFLKPCDDLIDSYWVLQTLIKKSIVNL
jgi:hypothetical protein